MKGCIECDKKLGFLHGYHHPTLGKNHLLCSSCFDTANESVEKYREFISPYIGFFKKEYTTNKTKFDRVNISKQAIHAVKMFGILWTGKEI